MLSGSVQLRWTVVGVTASRVVVSWGAMTAPPFTRSAFRTTRAKSWLLFDENPGSPGALIIEAATLTSNCVKLSAKNRAYSTLLTESGEVATCGMHGLEIDSSPLLGL